MKLKSQHDADLTFFLDRCLGRTIVAQKLREQGLHVEVHADNFPQTETEPEPDDAQWLREVGARGWVILTKDKSIQKNQIEIVSLLESGTATFVLTAGQMQGAQMAESFLKAMGSIRSLLARIERPFIAAVTASGKVRILYTHAQLVKKIE